VVALCDLVPERRNALGDELGISARYADLDEMVSQMRPDIVAIPTGAEHHYELSMRVLEHGINMEVEKPMCLDLGQADAMIARAREKGARLAVHHQGRVAAHTLALRRTIDEGRIGALRYMQASGKGYYGGYGMMEIGPHLANMLIALGGHCRSVSAMAVTDGHAITPIDVVQAPQGMGAIAGEHITASLQLQGNVCATLEQRRFPEVDQQGCRIDIFGTEGRIFWNFHRAWLLPEPHFRPDGVHDRWEELRPDYPDRYDPASGIRQDEYSWVDEYVKALDEDREHECGGEEARHVMEIMMGVFESAAYGRPVELPQPQRDHPLLRWRREHGLADPGPVPRPIGEWLDAEDLRLGRPAVTPRQ
jgi:predicted dehydrogenase